jgi:hypothetical protein
VGVPVAPSVPVDDPTLARPELPGGFTPPRPDDQP